MTSAGRPVSANGRVRRGGKVSIPGRVAVDFRNRQGRGRRSSRVAIVVGLNQHSCHQPQGSGLDFAEGPEGEEKVVRTGPFEPGNGPKSWEIS